MSFFFFFNDTATTEIYTLSLHDALPISWPRPCSFSPPTSRATLRGRCWSSTVAWCCDPIPSPPLRNAMAMDMKQLEEKVKDIIVEELGVERDKLTSDARDRKSTRLNSSHGYISYAVFCLKKKKKTQMYKI